MTALHGNLPDVVITEEPTGTKPILSLSFCIISPPFLKMAPATPPPCFRYELAAFTIASTALSVISPVTSLIILFCFLAAFDLESQPSLGVEDKLGL
jgi:hypothetical protein